MNDSCVRNVNYLQRKLCNYFLAKICRTETNFVPELITIEF